MKSCSTTWSGKIEEIHRAGLTPGQSRRAALRAMDGLTQRKEECRDMRRVNLIDNTVRDIRYGLRVLAKSPGSRQSRY